MGTKFPDSAAIASNNFSHQSSSVLNLQTMIENPVEKLSQIKPNNKRSEGSTDQIINKLDPYKFGFEDQTGQSEEVINKRQKLILENENIHQFYKPIKRAKGYDPTATSFGEDITIENSTTVELTINYKKLSTYTKATTDTSRKIPWKILPKTSEDIEKDEIGKLPSYEKDQIDKELKMEAKELEKEISADLENMKKTSIL